MTYISVTVFSKTPLYTAAMALESGAAFAREMGTLKLDILSQTAVVATTTALADKIATAYNKIGIPVCTDQEALDIGAPAGPTKRKAATKAVQAQLQDQWRRVQGPIGATIAVLLEIAREPRLPICG